MTKTDLVDQVHEAIGPGITKKDTKAVVDGFLNAIKKAMVEERRIELRGFGVFDVQYREGRPARNPRTGETVEVPPRAVPVWDASDLLCDRVQDASDYPEEKAGE